MYPKQTYLQPEDSAGLIDTHCHLDLEPLRCRLGDVLTEAHLAGVHHLVIPGIEPSAWSAIARIAAAHKDIHAAFGVHPFYATQVVDAVLGELEHLSASAVAIGEVGLDRRSPVPLDIQEQAFRHQIRVACAAGLPLLIHCRLAFQRTLQLLREEGAARVGGIIHAYSGSLEMAREFVKCGFAIGICGIVTWHGVKQLKRVVRELPLEYMVLETDAPDMTPELHRGERNHPAWLPEILESVAELRGVHAEEVALQVYKTTLRVLPKLQNV